VGSGAAKTSSRTTTSGVLKVKNIKIPYSLNFTPVTKSQLKKRIKVDAKLQKKELKHEMCLQS
jgi:hypothetical protein